MTEVERVAIQQILETIDRPGSFCVSGSSPAVLPGLEVEGLGSIGLPLTAKQAKELREHCNQAPYGKGEVTLVDKKVRRVWELKPERFKLTNPDWDRFLKDTVAKVQEELGLEKQKLESHLYDLLLYEKGSFFLPHRDGEKLDRMVATLVIVLPSTFEGGELVVRHEGQEQAIDFSGDNPFRIHYAAFYADCEHEVRPLRKGHRLCLVYNLTLAKSKKGKITAPRSSEAIEALAKLLGEWAKDDSAQKLVVTLDHQYTKDGLTWDALKGADRAKAKVLAEAARRADCQSYLALLTFHESGSAEGGYDYGYRRRGRWYDDVEEEEDAGGHTMGEVFDSELTAEHWSDPEGKTLPVEIISIKEEELLDPEALRDVDPETEFEGYTGNAGMTLDHWYRHGVIVLWPNRKHFEVFCDAGVRNAVPVFEQWVQRWRKASGTEAEALRAQCQDFASAIIARWPANPHGGGYGVTSPDVDLLRLIEPLEDPLLVAAYLKTVLLRDPSTDPGKALPAVCRKHGWKTFQPELEAAFQATTVGSLPRNVRLLEQVCTAKPGKEEGWGELCASLARTTVDVLIRIDSQPESVDWRVRNLKRTELLSGLAKSLVAAGQDELLSRGVEHALAHPKLYSLEQVHLPALAELQPWLAKNVMKPVPAVSRWVAACREQLEALTARAPEKPTDYRRPATWSCKCASCAELRCFLEDPREQVHRFRAVQHVRSHLEDVIRNTPLDLDTATERRGSPHTLVCTKNTASYLAAVRKFQEDQNRLATARAIMAKLPT